MLFTRAFKDAISQDLYLQANTGLIVTFAPFSYTKQAYKDLQSMLAEQYNTNIDFIIFQTYDTSISMSQWSSTWTALQQCKVMVACNVTAMVIIASCRRHVLHASIWKHLPRCACHCLPSVLMCIQNPCHCLCGLPSLMSLISISTHCLQSMLQPKLSLG